MRAAVIVAHPDDEVIWCGGLILRHQEWNWTVLSLCRGDDLDRAPKFSRVCDLLDVDGCISNLDDSPELEPIDINHELCSMILEFLPDGGWDVCITHGPGGEYGHQRHRDIHEAVKLLVKTGRLNCGELWTFAYRCDAATADCKPAADADMLLELTAAELDRKRKIVANEYGYAADSFEVRACISPEAFRIHKKV